MSRIRALALAFLIAIWAGPALAGSTVNVSIPPTGGALNSAPLRNNFAAAATDINNILSMFMGTTAPNNPSTLQQWADTSASPWNLKLWDSAAWVLWGTLNPSTHAFNIPTASGGSGASTPAGARANFDIDQITVHGDSNYAILATDRSVCLNAALTTARTWTLPAANAVNPGQHLTICDLVGGIGNSKTLTILRASSNTIDGGTQLILGQPYQSIDLVSDGTAKWKVAVRAPYITQILTSANNNLGIWIADNATYDPVADQWNRIDVSKGAMALNIRGISDIPGDPGTQGICQWRATAAANPIGAYGATGGWELVYCGTNFKDGAMGGFALEIDGNGTLGYSRFVNTNFGGHNYRGLLTNCFAQGTGVDDVTKPSWFVGQYDDSYALLRAAAGAGCTFTTLTSTDTSGNQTGTKLSSPVISGGTIDNAAIGATTPSTGKFTTLQATGFNSVGGQQDTSYSKQIPTTGFSITMSNGVFTLILDPAGTLATGTVVMPSAPADGQRVRVNSSQIITGLTVSPNSGQSLLGAPTTLALGGRFECQYVVGNTTWYC